MTKPEAMRLLLTGRLRVVSTTTGSDLGMARLADVVKYDSRSGFTTARGVWGRLEESRPQFDADTFRDCKRVLIEG